MVGGTAPSLLLITAPPSLLISQKEALDRVRPLGPEDLATAVEIDAEDPLPAGGVETRAGDGRLQFEWRTGDHPRPVWMAGRAGPDHTRRQVDRGLSH